MIVSDSPLWTSRFKSSYTTFEPKAFFTLRNSIRATGLLAAILAGIASCADPASTAQSPAALSALIAPHVERIAHFDRWAHRVASASGAWRSRSALEETAFSQIRTDPAVLAAWIERDGEAPLAYPAETPLPTAALRTIHVAPLGPCALATTSIERRGATTPAIVVALDHDGLRTTLALSPILLEAPR